MANKRIRKKQTKKRVETKLIQKGYTKKELKAIPKTEIVKVERNIKRNDARQTKRQNNRNFIRKNNLTESYKHNGKVYKGSDLIDLSPQVLKKFADLQQRREKERARAETKKQKMLDGGLSEHLADSYKNKSYKFVDDAIFKGDRTVYKSKEFLSVTWADVTGESNYSLALNEYDDKSTKDMIAEIHNTYNECKSAPKGDSSGFKGVAKIITSKDAHKISREGKKAHQKGYKSDAVYEGTMLMSADKFTTRGYANMMLSVMTRAKPEHVQQYYEEFETYAFNNLPEIHKQIFE